MNKHMCEYCCWYTEIYGCECPYVMEASACEAAINKKKQCESNVKKG